MKSDFPWGEVIDKFEYDFDGEVFSVTKYHPYISANCVRIIKIDKSKEYYHCEEIHEGDTSLFRLLISWMTYKKLGINNCSLSYGIARALYIND
jgi:hypothetical protein